MPRKLPSAFMDKSLRVNGWIWRGSIRIDALDAYRQAGRSQALSDTVGDCQAGGEPRRFNAKQVDQSGQAMTGRQLDMKIRRRFARAGKLWPDAAVAGLQALAVEVGEIAAHGLSERLPQSGIDRVIDVLQVM